MSLDISDYVLIHFTWFYPNTLISVILLCHEKDCDRKKWFWFETVLFFLVVYYDILNVRGSFFCSFWSTFRHLGSNFRYLTPAKMFLQVPLNEDPVKGGDQRRWCWWGAWLLAFMATLRWHFTCGRRIDWDASDSPNWPSESALILDSQERPRFKAAPRSIPNAFHSHPGPTQIQIASRELSSLSAFSFEA